MDVPRSGSACSVLILDVGYSAIETMTEFFSPQDMDM